VVQCYNRFPSICLIEHSNGHNGISHGAAFHQGEFRRTFLKNLFPPSIQIDRHEVYSSVLPIWTLSWIAKSWAEGLTGQAKEEFLNLKMSDLLDSGDKYLDRSFVKELSSKKNF
jgi:hypothetical protein